MTLHVIQIEDLEWICLEEECTLCHIRWTDCADQDKYNLGDKIKLRHKDYLIFDGEITGVLVGSELDIWGRTPEAME